MKTVAWQAVVLTGLVAALGCDGLSTQPWTQLSGPVHLTAPANGGQFLQNDASIGCADHPTRGRGMRLAFDWEDVPGATRYDIELRHTGSAFPAVRYAVGESSYETVACNAFVIDANLENWAWRVAAVGATESDVLWSEERVYRFAPCRLADATPCFANED